MAEAIQRHKAAIRRQALSRPLRLAIQAGALAGTSTVFDYGCGFGDDVRFLTTLGFHASGWDPHYRPQAVLRSADVCYLGYVLNVIEQAAERRQVLSRAWELAGRVLLVSALVTVDARGGGGIPFEDGIVTRIGTFQKYFDQQELENLLRQETCEEPIALAMGVFAVVKDANLRTTLLMRRIRASQRRVPGPTLAALVAQRREELQPLVDFHFEHGRWPADEEREPFVESAAEFGGIGRATRALDRAMSAALAEARASVQEDLLLFASIAHLDASGFAVLPSSLRRDLVAAFGSLARAKAAGQAELMSLGDVATRRAAAQRAGVGKRMPEALYVHISTVEELPRELRLYEAVARRFVGSSEDANLVKLHLDRPAVSYLNYLDFDDDPHPALAWSMVVDLQTFRIHLNSYSESANPPILHRKELFVGANYPLRSKFERLTRQEEKWDLYDGSTGPIGNRIQWQRRVDVAGLTFRGHRLVRAKG